MTPRNLSCFSTRMFLMLMSLFVIGLAGTGNSRKRDNFAPKIIEHPESVFVKKNAPTTLNCRAEGRPTPRITWLKDGELIQDDSHRTIGYTGALYFLRVISGQKRDDTGTYQCVATNDMGVAYSNNATLEVAFLRNDFREEPEDTIAIVGEPIVLVCTPPRGHPPPHVTWEKDKEIFEVDGSRVRIMEDGNLMISEARQSDSGNYVCLVENGYSDVKRSSPAVVNIHARPTFVSIPEDKTGAPGDTVSFKCQVEGDPQPTVRWSKQGGDLPQGRFSINDNTLHIYRITMADNGVYRCSADNIWGTSNMEATLTVTMKPTFTIRPEDTTVRLGETAVFHCKATGSPKPVIFWQKDNLEMIFSDGNSRLNVNEALNEAGSLSMLRINSVTTADEGYYVCTAIIPNVGSEEARAFLRIIVPQDQKPAPTGQPPPIIQYGPSNQTLVIGTQALFHCQATGVPQPAIEWTKDGNPVELSTQRYVSRFDIQESGALQISSLRQKDSGLYTCSARNENGETQWSATLTIMDNQDNSRLQETPSLAEFPNPPGQPSSSNVTLHSVRLQWDEPVRAKSVTHYQLESHNINSDLGWNIVSRRILETSYIVKNLTPDSTYRFLVRAVSSKAVGLPSVMSDPITTLEMTEAAPTMAQILAQTNPRITSAMALSQAAIKIVWEVEQNRDAVEGYFVKYKPRYSDHSFSSMEVVTGSTSNRILTGLEPAKEYLVMVQPFNGNVEGPDSQPVPVKTLSDGRDLEMSSGPVNAVLKEKLDTCGISIVAVKSMGPYTLKVSWSVERYSAYIDGYHIRFWPGRNNEEFSVESVSTDGETEAVLHSLEPWTEYTIAVQPFKDRFTGKFSQETLVRTEEDVPKAAPSKVDAKVYNNSSSIIVSWKEPKPNTIPGILLGYHVYCLGNASAQHQNTSVDNTSNTVVIDGLSPGYTYRVQVTAFTSAGQGPANKAKSIYLPEDEEGTTSFQQFSILIQTKWLIGFFSAVVVLIALCIFGFAWRKHNEPKQASPTNKASMSRDNGTVQNMPCLGGQINTNTSSNHQPVWTDQTWPPPHACQDNKCSHHGNNRGCMTTSSCCNGKSALNDSLDKNQFLYPSWGGTTGVPNMWQQYPAYDLESGKHPYPPSFHTQESKDTQDTQIYCGSNPTLSTFNNSVSRQGKVVLAKPSPCSTPEYAIVENDEYMGNSKCHNHQDGAVITVMPQDPMPYASATLFLAPNMREYMAHRNKCQENSADSRCSSRINSSRVDSGMYGDIDPAIYSETGSLPGLKQGMTDPPLSSLSEYATVGHSDSGNSTGTDERGSRRKFKMRNGLSNKHPARNWKELLPPPPEQPPTDIDSPPSSPDYPCSPITYSAHGTPNCCQSSNACPSNSCHDMHCQEGGLSMPRDRAPLPPVRQHHSMSPECGVGGGETTGLLMPNGQCNPHGSKGVEQHFLPNNLPSHQKELHIEQTVPLLSNMPDRPGDAIAPGQVFEDPRHEQLGKELLEFNDDISQSEICSENEDDSRHHDDMDEECAHLSSGYDRQSVGVVQRPAYPVNGNVGCQGDIDSDNETASICTDSMLATWDSVNGSTASSPRNSCASLSSEGSYFTNSDFASAVAAAAELAGMQVAANSQNGGQRQVKNPKPIGAPQVKSHSHSDPTASPSMCKQPPPPVAKKPTENSIKGESTVNGSNSPVLQRVKSLPQSGNHSNSHHGNGSSRHSSPAGSRKGSLKHPGKENGVNPSEKKLFMRETNDIGLTVTANPMAFEHEKMEKLHV